MQKKSKRIIMLTILLLIILAIILLILNTNKPMPQSLTEQAKAEYTTQIGTQAYDITNAVLQPNEIVPTISAGMIPIKWNGTNWVITTVEDKEWYNYSNGKPAYIMLNDGYYKSELQQGITEEQLMSNAVGNDAIVVPNAQNNNPSIYMWIPRFAYNSQGEILYIKQGCSVAGTYTMPEIFTYQTEKRDFSLAGIWIEYTPLANTSTANAKVNNMTGENNQYGFIANTIATNANNEPSYKTTVETYNQYIANAVGATSVRNTPENLPNVALATEEYPGNVENDAPVVPQITDPSNTNRTILKITNSNKLEPIKGTAYYDETEEKIKIEVTYRTNAITKILNSKGNILSENSTIADSGDEIIGNKTYKFIVIDNLGNQKQIETTVTGLDVYIIENEDDLKLFRDAVNAGKTTTSTKAYQIANVKMNEGKYTIDTETGDITFAEDAEKWVPIGVTNYIYQGVYYGNNHTISGMYINTTATNQGLFSICSDTTINDLGIINSRITGGYTTGSIVGLITKNGGVTLNNCYSTATLECNSNNIGGLVGTAGSLYQSAKQSIIESCYSRCEILAYKGSSIGGIMGTAININIINCYNEGQISGNGDYIGGIVGKTSTKGTIENCYNTANIQIEGAYIGGIVGCSQEGINNICNCDNKGKISGTGYIGGIAGASTNSMINCKNYGEISGVCSGGILGQANTVNISLCGNEAKVKGTSLAGGIIGETNSKTNSISQCYNKGEVQGTTYSGGIVGAAIYNNSTSVYECYNFGNITGGSKGLGGISGTCPYISNCYNIGKINGTGKYIGGIIGENIGVVKNCYNKGKIQGLGTNSITGGIAGCNLEGNQVLNCYNMGDIKGYDNIGGIVGYNKSSDSSISKITGCCNGTEEITATGGTYFGAICGNQANENKYYSSYRKGYTYSSSYLKNASQLNGIGYDTNLNEGCTAYLDISLMPTILSVINSDKAFVEDTEGINNGYPLLAWQVEKAE